MHSNSTNPSKTSLRQVSNLLKCEPYELVGREYLQAVGASSHEGASPAAELEWRSKMMQDLRFSFTEIINWRSSFCCDPLLDVCMRSIASSQLS